jgi:HEAT repeat protein
MGTGKLIFREGAAIALALIDTREANNILKKASKSKFKVIRKAFDRTETIRAVSGENTND